MVIDAEYGRFGPPLQLSSHSAREVLGERQDSALNHVADYNDEVGKPIELRCDIEHKLRRGTQATVTRFFEKQDRSREQSSVRVSLTTLRAQRFGGCVISMRSCCHGSAMSGGRLPVIDPSLADCIGSFNQIMAGNMSVLDHENDPSVELPLRVIDIG